MFRSIVVFVGCLAAAWLVIGALGCAIVFVARAVSGLFYNLRVTYPLQPFNTTGDRGRRYMSRDTSAGVYVAPRNAVARSCAAHVRAWRWYLISAVFDQQLDTRCSEGSKRAMHGQSLRPAVCATACEYGAASQEYHPVHHAIIKTPALP